MAYDKRFDVSIIGAGFLGSALSSGFSNYSKIKIYDKFKDYDTLEDTVAHGSIIFFCLPTPMDLDDDGRQDLSILDGSLNEVHSLIKEGETKIAVIKSTVLPGTNRAFQAKYPRLKFVSNPEFLSASSARVDFICMSRNILGGEPEYVDQVDALYKHRFGNSLLTFKTSWEAAELSKYGANMFFAVKLSFFNYIYSVCENLGLDYDQVRDMVVSDARLGRSHDKIPGADSKLGWGNFCFPKDLAAFINYSKDLGMNPELLEATWNQNLRDRGERDWEQLPGVVSKRKKDGQT